MKKIIIIMLLAIVATTSVFAAEPAKSASFFKADIVGWQGGYTFGKEYANGNRLSISLVTNTITYATIINVAWAGDAQWSIKTALMPVTPEGFSFNYGRRLTKAERQVELSVATSIGCLVDFQDPGVFIGIGTEISFDMGNDRADAIYARIGVVGVAFFSKNQYGYYVGPYYYILPYYVGIGYKYYI